ncbi:1-phosphofructokinase [Eubacteriales bacterium mix99]|jgi:1-phosphofructokinase
MITTVTMNPGVDKTVTVDTFHYGGLNRVQNGRLDVGGKGINVASVYTNLGGTALCTGINYQSGGDLIRERLSDRHVRHDFVMVPGELRTNLKLFDRSKGVVTEVNESGFPVQEGNIQVLKEKVRRYSRESSMMVFSGSVPRGVGSGVYRELMEECAGDCRLVLDAEGPLLSEGLKAQPYLIKPNRFELEKILGEERNTKEEIVEGARELLRSGVQILCVSLGAQGAVIVDPCSAYFAPALPVKVQSTVGAGDSMVAALCLAAEEDRPPAEMLRMATAAAAASVMTEGTQLCSRSDFDALLPQVSVTRIEE